MQIVHLPNAGAKQCVQGVLSLQIYTWLRPYIYLAMQIVCWHVCLQGASKGNAVDRILKQLADEGNAPDFVLCIGDDRSDEDMFTAMEHVTFSPHLPAEVWPCPCCTIQSQQSTSKLAFVLCQAG